MPGKPTKPKALKVQAKAIIKPASKASAVKAGKLSKEKGKGKGTIVVSKPTLLEEEEVESAEGEEDVSASSDQEGDSDSEGDDGVDEEGMERLLNALGDDGLDDFDRAQILSLNGLEEDEAGESEGEEAGGSEGSDEPVEKDSEVEDEDDEQEGTDEISGSEADVDADEEKPELDIPLDEAEDSVDEDAVPTRKVEVDNTIALARIRNTIALDPSLPWTETLVVSYPQTIDVDVDDDLNREVAFYKQALYCANEARKLAAKHKFPFTRPSDYFAEMVKSDSHMERIRQRLLNETAAIKTSEEKRKQREGKKFGKQVQIEKLKEREKSKKEMEEKLKGLKRKRKDMLTTDGEGRNARDDEFDVAVEDAISDKPSARPSKRTKMSRDGRDKKFGFGSGADRRSKQNTRESTDSFVGAGKGRPGNRPGSKPGGRPGSKHGAGGKKTAPRPGKSKRMNSRRK